MKKKKEEPICKRCEHLGYTTTQRKVYFQVMFCMTKKVCLLEDAKAIADLNKYHPYKTWIATPESCKLFKEKV